MGIKIGPQIDIKQRFREEVRGLPRNISLVGNSMQKEIAKQLLQEYEHIAINNGTPVHLMSMEAYGSAFLAAFMEEQDPPQGPFLLHTIPEEELIKYAKEHDISVVHEQKNDIRKMLDKIAEHQPQTYFSLTRSAQRLKSAAELLRKQKAK